MDPITFVVTAVALGASAALTDTASEAVKTAYARLSALLTGRGIDVTGVERKPGSTSKQDSLGEDLEETEDAVDDPLLDAARQVIAAVKAHDPAAGEVIGIDLEGLQAASLRVSGLTSEGTGVRGKNWTITGDAVFEDIQAGRGAADPEAPGGTGGAGHPS